MAGPNPPKGSSSSSSHHKNPNPNPNYHHHSSSSHHNHRKSRWESDKKPSSDPKPPPLKSNPSPKPTPKSNPSPKLPQPGPNSSTGPFPDPLGPPPMPRPPAYGFHMLDRRTIVLADGSVRSYFALPPDYQDFPVPPARRHPPELLGPMSPEFRELGRGPAPEQQHWNMMGKRKFIGDEGRDEFAWQRQQLLQFGNAGSGVGSNREFVAGPSNDPYGEGMMRVSKQMRFHEGGIINGNRYNEVEQGALKKAFLHYVKLIFDNMNQKKAYLANGKQGPLPCVACTRSTRDFPDMHALILHTYNPDRPDLLVDHLGLHKALCVLMGWNYSKAPDNSKAYQSLFADEAAAIQDDLIMWPPMVVVHNTITGKGKEGRMEGLGNKAMDVKLRELGFASGKAKAVYGREGHLGITLVKFSADLSGLKEAVRFSEFFEKEKRGRKGWARVQSSSTMGKEDENNPNLMEVDKKTGEKQRIFYGYLGTISDLDKVDNDTRRKITVESKREFSYSK